MINTTLPRSLDVLVHYYFVEKRTKTGKVTKLRSLSHDLPILKILSEILGFSYTLYDQSYRRHADLYIGDLVVQDHDCSRSVFPHEVSEITFGTAKPDYLSNALAHTRTFTFSVWLGLFLSILLMTFAHFLVFRRKVPFMSVLFYTSVTFLGKYRNWRPKSNAQKLLILICSVGMTILTLSYGSAILSFLTVPSRGKGITDLNELYEAIVQGKVTATQFYESDMAYVLSMCKNKKLEYIASHLMNQNQITFKNGDNFLDVIKSNVVVISQRTKLQSFYGGRTHFTSKDSVLWYMSAVYDYTRDGFCCMEQFNKVIQRMWAAGLNQKIFSDSDFKEMIRFVLKYKNIEEDPVQPLSLSSMSGVFYFLITGHVLGLVCLACEILTHRYLRSA